MTTVPMAEVAYPVFSEVGIPKIGALVLGAGEVPGSKMKKLGELLPPEADLWYRNGTFRIELDVPRERRSKAAMHRLAILVRSAISRSLGVKAGLCPVRSSSKILDLVRRG